MAFEMSDKSQTVKVYNLRSDTCEFIGEGDVWIPARTGLPANCTDIAPPEIPAGKVAIFNAHKLSWELVEDYRGKTVFNITSGEAIYINTPGAIPGNTTEKEPTGIYQKWDGNAWVQDEEALQRGMVHQAENHQKSLLASANETISLWQSELLLGIIADEDKQSLIEWINYIKELQSLDFSPIVDEASYDAFAWPSVPNASDLVV